MENQLPVRQDNAPKKRVELHVCTNMSDGVSSAETLITRASEFGHTAIAITDVNVVQAFPEAARIAEKLKSVKILYGSECRIMGPSGHSCPTPIIILAKNQAGLKNLYRLVSWLHLESIKSSEPWCLTQEKLSELKEGLIIGSADVSGETCRLFCDKISGFYDFLGITPHMSKEEVRKIARLGEECSIPVCAVGDVHYCDPVNNIFLGMIKEDQDPDDPYYFPSHLLTTEGMLKAFDFLGEEKAYEVVVTNTNRIADEIEVLHPVPNGIYRPEIEGAEDELSECVYQCAKSNYGNPIPDFVKDRIENELNSIISNGFATHYIIAKRLVDHAKEDGYAVGTRGSVGSSLIAYLSGITQVNPLPPHYICPSCHHAEQANSAADSGYDLLIKPCPVCSRKMQGDGHNIPFETFAGLYGSKEPDIDLNFPNSYQTKAKEHLHTMFGKERVLYAGTISPEGCRRAAKIVERFADRHHVSLSNEEIALLAQGLEGKKRCTGVHLGGIMIIPDGYDAEEFTPLQYASDDPKTSAVTTHFHFHDIQDALLKLDILGYTVLDRLKLLEKYTGIKASDVPTDDPAVYSLFTSPEALGVTAEEICFDTGTLSLPEFSTSFVEHMLKVCQPKNFSELVRLSGLAHGTGVWRDNAEHLISDGTASISEVIGARDDIMLDLIKYGIDRATAYKIMEITRKGKAATNLTPQHIQTMSEHHVPQWYINSIKKISYMFPKAHAVEYVRYAVILAWYKLYHPQAYYQAYFEVERESISEEDLAVIKSGDAAAICLKISETPSQALRIAYEAACRGVDVRKLV